MFTRSCLGLIARDRGHERTFLGSPSRAAGESSSRRSSTARRGPPLKTQWTQPISWSEGWRTRSYTVPGGRAFGPEATGFFCRGVAGGSRALVRLVDRPLEFTLVLAGRARARGDQRSRCPDRRREQRAHRLLRACHRNGADAARPRARPGGNRARPRGDRRGPADGASTGLSVGLRQCGAAVRSAPDRRRRRLVAGELGLPDSDCDLAWQAVGP